VAYNTPRVQSFTPALERHRDVLAPALERHRDVLAPTLLGHAGGLPPLAPAGGGARGDDSITAFTAR
jgi:hypothetical protein